MEIEFIPQMRFVDYQTYITVNTRGECLVTYGLANREPFGDGSFTIALGETDEEGDLMSPSDEQLHEFLKRSAMHLEQMQIALRYIAKAEEEGDDYACHKALDVAILIADAMEGVAKEMGIYGENY